MTGARCGQSSWRSMTEASDRTDWHRWDEFNLRPTLEELLGQLRSTQNDSSGSAVHAPFRRVT